MLGAVFMIVSSVGCWLVEKSIFLYMSGCDFDASSVRMLTMSYTTLVNSSILEMLSLSVSRYCGLINSALILGEQFESLLS